MAPELKMRVKKKTSSKKAFASSPSKTPWITALIDPFTAEAVQLPDEYAGGTVPLKLIEDYTITLDPSGSAIVALSPSLARSYYTTTITAGAVATQAFAAHPDYTDFNAQFSYSRTLIMGVEITYIGSDTDNSGRVCVASAPNIDYTNVGTTMANIFDDAADPGPLREGLLVVARPVQPPRFELVNVAAAGLGTVPVVTVAITGGKPSTACLNIRCVKFVEAQPTKGSLHRAASSVEPYDMFTMAAAANMAMNEPPVYPNTDGGRQALKDEGRDLADMAVDFLTGAARELGVPGAGLAKTAYHVSKDMINRLKHR